MQSKFFKVLVDKANNRIREIKSGAKPALRPDANAKYHAEVVVDLMKLLEPMIADPDVNNEDVSKRYTHDTLDHCLSMVVLKK